MGFVVISDYDGFRYSLGDSVIFLVFECEDDFEVCFFVMVMIIVGYV